MSASFASFVERCAQQQKAKEDLGNYNQVLGDYGEATFATGVPLEMFLVQRIARLLDQSGGPAVMAVDIGGGAGTTWLKLAGTFPGAIARRQLGLFVTNQTGSPEDYHQRYEASYGESAELLTSQELYEQFGSGVQYLNTDFSGQSPMPNLFRGLMSVVHERRSVTAWSKIPELHIARIGRLVADQGVYLVDGADSEDMYSAHTPWEYLERWDGIRAAHQALPALYNLVPVQALEAGPYAGVPLDYTVFKGPAAMPVSVGRD
jgi:hypothetical protein